MAEIKKKPPRESAEWIDFPDHSCYATPSVGAGRRVHIVGGMPE